MNISPLSSRSSSTGSFVLFPDNIPTEKDDEVNFTTVEDPPADLLAKEPEAPLNLDELEDFQWLLDPTKHPVLNEGDYDGCEFLDSGWEPSSCNEEPPPSYLTSVFNIIQELQPLTGISSAVSTIAAGSSSIIEWGYNSSQELFQSIGLSSGVVRLSHALVAGKNAVNNKFVFSDAQARQIKDAALNLEEKRRQYFWLRSQERDQVNNESEIVKQSIESNVMYAAALVVQYSITNGLHQTTTGTYEWLLYKVNPSQGNRLL